MHNVFLFKCMFTLLDHILCLIVHLYNKMLNKKGWIKNPIIFSSCKTNHALTQARTSQFKQLLVLYICDISVFLIHWIQKVTSHTSVNPDLATSECESDHIGVLFGRCHPTTDTRLSLWALNSINNQLISPLNVNFWPITEAREMGS